MPKRKGFTLIELLVVVAIIALLVAILVPSLTKAKEQANRAVCGANLHQIMLGMRMYHDDYNAIPPITPADPLGRGLFWADHSLATMQGFYAGGVVRPDLKTPRGLGYIYHLGYAPSPEIYWCPSTEFPWHPGASKEEHIQNLMKYTAGDITRDDFAVSSYIYRVRTGYVANAADIEAWHGTQDGRFGHLNHVVTVKDWSGSLSAVADHHTYPEQEPGNPGKSHHKDGLNAAYWDGSVSWVADPNGSHSWGAFAPSGILAGSTDEPYAQTMWWLTDFPTQGDNYPP